MCIDPALCAKAGGAVAALHVPEAGPIIAPRLPIKQRSGMPLDPQKLMALQVPGRDVTYGEREILQYALAVGLGAGGADEDLPFVYERGVRVVPSLATVLAFDDDWIAACGIDLRTVVHGALDLAFHRPLAPQGKASVAMRLVGLDDKGPGRGGLVFQESVIAQAGVTACTVLSTLFVRGAGGFGGAVGRVAAPHALPDSAPDATSAVATAPNQALLFRLLGDRNPLHVDPAVARQAGFARPILHGACTFGIACAEVLRRFCAHDPDRLARLAARFAGPLYPGETLDFSFWRGPAGIGFRATAAERQAVVLDNGFAVTT